MVLYHTNKPGGIDNQSFYDWSHDGHNTHMHVILYTTYFYCFRFNCEGTSLSGMQLDLVGQAYRISFKKNKLSSGRVTCTHMYLTTGYLYT